GVFDDGLTAPASRPAQCLQRPESSCGSGAEGTKVASSSIDGFPSAHGCASEAAEPLRMFESLQPCGPESILGPLFFCFDFLLLRGIPCAKKPCGFASSSQA